MLIKGADKWRKERSDLSDQQAQELLNGVFDQKKVLLICSKHGRTEVPTAGCRDCWFAYYVRTFAKIPREQWAQQMAELREIIIHMHEEIAQGRFDFVPLASPKIEIEKDAAPDPPKEN